MSYFGYNGVILEIDLTKRKIIKTPLAEENVRKYIGGRGLGAKLLTERIQERGLDPLSPDNPILFMPGPFSGFPIPSASRLCVVTKSPKTSSVNKKYKHGSTISYTNMGGYFAPEIRFAGYDGIIVTGKASNPVMIIIEDEEVQIRDMHEYWGMGTNEFDKKVHDVLPGKDFQTIYIGPAGEKQVRYACILHTAARAAGRGGAGCVMGAKNLKAIAVKGSKQPKVGRHIDFLNILEEARQSFLEESPDRRNWRWGGTANALSSSSDRGTQAVKNYREGTFQKIEEIGTEANRKKVWSRDHACYCCALACKKAGVVKEGPYEGIVHDGPEYETGTMLGPNLMIADLGGLQKGIFMADYLGMDTISLGNVIGFLMECYDKKLIDLKFLDGIDLKWGEVDPVLKLIDKIANREGVGDIASKGVKELAQVIGQGSEKFAIHVKGHELAAWNVHVMPDYMGISYTMSNRGACHLNGGSVQRQNDAALRDSLGICSFPRRWFRDNTSFRNFLNSITGIEWTEEDYKKAGERIFNLEKVFNIQEGFDANDDILPERFYTEPLTYGAGEGKVADRESFRQTRTGYYEERGWDVNTSVPTKEKLKSLGIDY